MAFINRERELQQLDDLCAQDRAHMVVLYGRRRIGKSALLFEWKVLERLIDRGNRWLGGDTGWDVHYALFAREFGQVRATASQEPGFYFFTPADILKASAA